MNSAELVNLILKKLRWVKFLHISGEDVANPSVRFVLRNRQFTAVFQKTAPYDSWKNTPGEIKVFCFLRGKCDYDFVTKHIEKMLNGKVRNDAGELVKP